MLRALQVDAPDRMADMASIERVPTLDNGTGPEPHLVVAKLVFDRVPVSLACLPESCRARCTVWVRFPAEMGP